jgi:SAM-dependent methyltransferase
MTGKAKCPICGSENTAEIFSGYTLCRDCVTAHSSGQAKPIPADPVENNELVYYRSKIKLFTQGLREIKRAAGGRPGRLLDIGCGHGYFMKLASEWGWETEGVEISEAAREYAKQKFGFNVYGRPVGELSLPEGSYDVVTLWGVLDVLPDPLAELKEIYRILKPGGIIYLRVNNLSFHLPGYRLGTMPLFKKLGIEPGIFHRWGISKKSLEALFGGTGFKGLKVYNSRMTSGDPYGTGGRIGKSAVVLAKALYYAASQALYFATFGGSAVSSCLIASAEKPE